MFPGTSKSPIAPSKKLAAPIAPLVGFDRPEVSPILAVLDDLNDPAYLEALEIIRAGQAQLTERPDVEMEGFELSGIDLRRGNKYQERRRAKRSAAAASVTMATPRNRDSERT